MTLRITLLVLATGLFSLIWINDRQTPRAQNPKKPLAADADPLDQPLAKDRESPQSIGPRQTASFPLLENLTRRITQYSLNRMRRQTIISWKQSYRQIGAAGRQWTENQIAKYSERLKRWTLPLTNGSKGKSATLVRASADHSELFAGDDMPLPAGILPGDYRAVSNTGIVRTLTLTWEQLQNHTGGPALTTRDVYESRGEKLRWYFIRVQADPEAAGPAIAERSTRRQRTVGEIGVSERIEKQAGQIILRAGRTMIERLATMMENRNQAARRLESLLKSPLRMSAEETDKTPL